MASALEPHLRLEVGHILFLDIVGFSRLLADEQKESVQELNQVVRETKQFQAAEAEGKLTRLPTGDGMVLVFTNNPEAPVECALEISRTLQSRPRLRLRMGIHSGPVNPVADVNDQANLAGAGINIAQRVMSCGNAGHILLSKHFAEDLEHYAHWRSHLHDVGEVESKHGARILLVNLYTERLGNSALPEKFKLARAAAAKERTRVLWRRVSLGTLAAVVIAIAIGFAALRAKRTSLAITEKSIAVLPFENLSEEKQNAYFATGIQNEILTRLAKIALLKVTSHTSTQQYPSRPGNLREIARQLAVANVLEGSVQKSGDQVHINVQLIRAATDEHLWAESYDRELENIFSVEAEVAAAVAGALKTKLTSAEQEAVAAKPTENTAAYDAYLRGLAYTLRTTGSPANSLDAQKYLREAVRLDPKFALAWALLSTVEARGYLSMNLQPTVSLREEARQAAETALTLQPNLGEAVLAKGFYHYACLKDYDTAARYFEQARQLLPNSSRIPQSLANLERRRGQWNRSESYFNEAERLDPRNLALLTQYAALYTDVRRFREALRKLDQVLNITPDDPDALALQAAVAQAEGDLPRAAALLARIHPGADDTGALETQVYQAILERRSAPIIPHLKEILARPDPALGYFIGELRFCLGWAQRISGDHAAAQESWRQARSELEPFLEQQPENFQLVCDLALTNGCLGDKAAALALCERAMATLPIEKDALFGPIPIEILARVAAQIGEPDRAIAALQRLVSIPYRSMLGVGVPLTPALLRLDPMFDPLRNDPRFQKLAASETPKSADK